MDRILGRCPSCQREDCIFALPGRDIAEACRCIYCKCEWAGWPRLLAEERQEGHGSELIPVAIRNENGIAELIMPERSNVPFADTILTVFGAAVLITFTRLKPYPTDAGGLAGQVGKHPVIFRNQPDTIGISYTGDDNLPCIQASRRVLKFYEKILRRTFGEPMRCGGRIVRPGALLRLDVLNPENELAAWEHVRAALLTIGSGYPGAVEHMIRSLSREDRRFLRGFNEEEMAKLFSADDAE